MDDLQEEQAASATSAAALASIRPEPASSSESTYQKLKVISAPAWVLMCAAQRAMAEPTVRRRSVLQELLARLSKDPI